MKKSLAEFIGTFALVFCGTGAIVINQELNGVIGHLGIALTFGAIVAVMIYALGDVSGAHLNPAVTFGFWIAKEFPAKEIAPYIIGQFAGAFAASGLLHWMFPAHQTLGSTLPSGSELQSFLMEVIISYILLLVIFQVAKGTKEKGMFAGIAIGSVVLITSIFAGPICGSSMNPARSLAPALISGNMQHIWIYMTAPFIGTFLAFVSWKYFKSNPASSSQ